MFIGVFLPFACRINAINGVWNITVFGWVSYRLVSYQPVAQAVWTRCICLQNLHEKHKNGFRTSRNYTTLHRQAGVVVMLFDRKLCSMWANLICFPNQILKTDCRHSFLFAGDVIAFVFPDVSGLLICMGCWGRRQWMWRKHEKSRPIISFLQQNVHAKRGTDVLGCTGQIWWWWRLEWMLLKTHLWVLSLHCRVVGPSLTSCIRS